MKKINLKVFMLAAIFCGCLACNNCVVSADYSSNVPEQSIGVNSDMENYIRLARRSIKNNWYPPVTSFEHSARLSLKVDKNGQLQDCHILESSNDKAFDDSLIDAAKKTTYKPLPESYKREKAELNLSFSMQRHHVSK